MERSVLHEAFESLKFDSKVLIIFSRKSFEGASRHKPRTDIVS